MQANMVVVTQMSCDATKVVRQVYKELNPSIDEDGPIDITVSFGGSWMTRGHRSNYGIGCVVEVVTGLVLDLAILSLYCQGCAMASTCYGGKHTAKWHDKHTDCNQNYTGASGEMEAAEILWSLSLDKHGFQYTTLLSDGDAKTFKHLCSLKVYGDIRLKKEEYVNHVAKRLGTALCNLATQGKKKSVILDDSGQHHKTDRVLRQGDTCTSS